MVDNAAYNWSMCFIRSTDNRTVDYNSQIKGNKMNIKKESISFEGNIYEIAVKWLDSDGSDHRVLLRNKNDCGWIRNYFRRMHNIYCKELNGILKNYGVFQLFNTIRKRQYISYHGYIE